MRLDDVKKTYYEVLIFSKNDNILFSGGRYDSKKAALESVDTSLLRDPSAARWKVIKITKEVCQEGTGPIPRQPKPARASRAGWL